jgi:hypothetical protein
MREVLAILAATRRFESLISRFTAVSGESQSIINIPLDMRPLTDD